MTREDLVKLFGLSLNEAADHVGVGRTLFKKVCRRHGIGVWPQVQGKGGGSAAAAAAAATSGPVTITPWMQMSGLPAAAPAVKGTGTGGAPEDASSSSKPMAVGSSAPRSSPGSRRRANKPAGLIKKTAQDEQQQPPPPPPPQQQQQQQQQRPPQPPQPPPPHLYGGAVEGQSQWQQLPRSGGAMIGGMSSSRTDQAVVPPRPPTMAERATKHGTDDDQHQVPPPKQPPPPPQQQQQQRQRQHQRQHQRQRQHQPSGQGALRHAFTMDSRQWLARSPSGTNLLIDSQQMAAVAVASQSGGGCGVGNRAYRAGGRQSPSSSWGTLEGVGDGWSSQPPITDKACAADEEEEAAEEEEEEEKEGGGGSYDSDSAESELGEPAHFRLRFAARPTSPVCSPLTKPMGAALQEIDSDPLWLEPLAPPSAQAEDVPAVVVTTAVCAGDKRTSSSSVERPTDPDPKGVTGVTGFKLSLHGDGLTAVTAEQEQMVAAGIPMSLQRAWA
eukprot:SAG22_NODE_1411_length_4480_cov_1.789137_2_plen_499_part_00